MPFRPLIQENLEIQLELVVCELGSSACVEYCLFPASAFRFLQFLETKDKN